MINLQPIEKQVAREDGALDVHSIFLTIQGEGPFAGVPAVFLRLAACNLQCPACDTEYTQGRQLMSVIAIADKVMELTSDNNTRLVVLTGGEPFRQATGPVIKQLIELGFRVQVETNGTLYDSSLSLLGFTNGTKNDKLTIVCSPKTAAVNSKLLPWIDHFKYIISAGKVDPIDGLPTDSLNFGVRPARPPVKQYGFGQDIYCQPCDDQDATLNAAHSNQTINSCIKFGYRYCAQIHKIINLP